MADLVPEIERTAKLVQEITAASLEQQSGTDQVNTAIQQLNQVTQQNAAASEEMATSAEELSSQAEQLQEIISYFKVDDLKTSLFNPKQPVMSKNIATKIVQNSGIGNGKLQSNGATIEMDNGSFAHNLTNQKIPKYQYPAKPENGDQNYDKF
jgi:methyl-accepting chemotaxis protein